MRETRGFGRRLPVRPAPHGVSPLRCLRGHDLSIAGAGASYHHLYGVTELTCNVCDVLRDPLASWCLVDPAVQHTAATAPRDGLALVRIPPTVPRGGVGQLQLRIEGDALGDLDLAVCSPCRRAVLEQVRVDEGHRRMGYGRVLVAAALALAPPAEYRWSTTKINRNDIIARAFWSGIDWPGGQDGPDYCTDMERAAGRLPDW